MELAILVVVVVLVFLLGENHDRSDESSAATERVRIFLRDLSDRFSLTGVP